MSLLLIKQNVEKNVIRTTEEFSRDVMLMLVNALMYNNHEYDVYAMAQEMYDEALLTIEQHTQNTWKESSDTVKPTMLRGRRSESAVSVDKVRGERFYLLTLFYGKIPGFTNSLLMGVVFCLTWW